MAEEYDKLNYQTKYAADNLVVALIKSNPNNFAYIVNQHYNELFKKDIENKNTHDDEPEMDKQERYKIAIKAAINQIRVKLISNNCITAQKDDPNLIALFSTRSMNPFNSINEFSNSLSGKLAEQGNNINIYNAEINKLAKDRDILPAIEAGYSIESSNNQCPKLQSDLPKVPTNDRVSCLLNH
jgi:hypothetical protein